MLIRTKRTGRPLIIYYLLLFFGISTYAQTPTIDSLLVVLESETDPVNRGDILLQLTRLHINDLPKFLEYLDQAATIPAFASDSKWSNHIQFLRGFYFERLRNFDSARIYFQNVLDAQSVTITDTQIVSATYFKLGNMARLEGNQDNAIEFFQKSLQLDEARSDENSVAGTQIVLGVIYKNIGLYDQAITYYQQAYDTYAKSNHYENMATCMLNIANVYSRQKKYPEAIDQFQKALEFSENVSNPDNLLAFIYGNLGNCYTQQNDHAQALNYTQRAYELMKGKTGPEEQATMLIGISNSLRELGRLNESASRLQDAQKMCENADGLIQVQERIQYQLYHIYLEQNRLKEANDAIQLHLKLHDSLQRSEVSKQLLEINTKYETEKKENEIALLNADNELVAAHLQAAKNRNVGLLVGFILVGGLLTVVYRLFQKTKWQNKQISKALHEKEVLLREIHHRVKNNLQVISSLLALQSEHVDDNVALSALQEGQDRVQSMALIHQNLYQDHNLTGVSINEYFTKLIRNLFDSYNIRKDQIRLEMNIDPLNLDVDTVVPIGLIVNELVSNSLKYAFPDNRKGTIWVDLVEKGQQLYLSIKDDGIGMPPEREESLGQSFGYRLIKIFTRQLKGTLSITGDPGTQVSIAINKYSRPAV